LGFVLALNVDGVVRRSMATMFRNISSAAVCATLSLNPVASAQTVDRFPPQLDPASMGWEGARADSTRPNSLGAASVRAEEALSGRRVFELPQLLVVCDGSLGLDLGSANAGRLTPPLTIRFRIDGGALAELPTPPAQRRGAAWLEFEPQEATALLGQFANGREWVRFIVASGTGTASVQFTLTNYREAMGLACGWFLTPEQVAEIERERVQAETERAEQEARAAARRQEQHARDEAMLREYRGWNVRTDTSRLDGRRSAIVLVRASNFGSADRIADVLGAPSLTVRCAENRTAIFVTGAQRDYTSFGFNPQSVTYRIDDGPIRSMIWHPSDSGSALGSWRGEGVPLIRDIARGTRELYLRVAPRGRTEMELQFDLRDHRAAIEQVALACGWRL
jgi:hypothetical protein